MLETTKFAIEKAISDFSNDWVTNMEDRLEGISFKTFKKYVKLETRVCETFREVSLEELVEILNSCSDTDCYGACWEYRVIDGKPYEVLKTVQSRIIGIEF